MAFVNRIGNVLKNTLSKHVQLEVSASNPVFFQAIRNMSSSKLFVGGASFLPFTFMPIAYFFAYCYLFLFYIAGLSYNMDEMSLREAFAGCGEVVEGTCCICTIDKILNFMLILHVWYFDCFNATD